MLNIGATAINQFLYELKRRKVVKALIAYAIVGWLLIEAASLLEEVLELPDWTDRLFVVLVGLGLPLAIILAWIFDITPQGIERTARSPSNTDSADARTSIAWEKLELDDSIASVCVLPFDNLSPEDGKEWMAEGLASEIQSTLDRMHRIRVASRRSSLQFRDSDKSVKEIAQALNARYVLSGSLVCSGDRVRVNVELDDAETDSQIWSERYERSLDDLLVVQGEIAEAIVGAFGVERQRVEITGTFKKPTENLDAWGTVQRARRYLIDFNKESLDEARTLLSGAIQMDPEYAAAQAALGSVLAERALNGFSDDMNAERAEALAAVTRAQQLAPHDPFVLKMSGMVLAICGRAENSIRCLRTCLELAPYDFGAWGYLGWPLVAKGEKSDLEEVHEVMDRLLSTAPDHPGAGYWHYHNSVAFQVQENLSASAESIRCALDKHAQIAWMWMQLASVCGISGEIENAKEASERAIQVNEKMTPKHFADCIRAMSQNERIVATRLDGLVTAGLIIGD